MALKLYSTYVLGHRYHGLSSHCSNAHLTFHSPGLHPISSNRRRRNYSSQNRKQPLKRIPRRRPPVDLKFQQSEDENADGQTSITDGVSDSHQDSGSNAGFDSTAVIENSNEADFGNATDVQKAITDEVSDYQQDAGSNSGSYSNTVIEISDETDFETATLAVETKSLAEDADGEEQLTNIRLEDLISMIKNAEKNVLLLNEARVRALEDLDKILIEKDSLQGEIDILEMRLAETDAKMNVAAEEKINVELLEDQLESLKNEMSKREYSSKYILYEDNTKIPNLESPVLHDSGINAISMELDVVRKENLSLKDDIQTLKAKLAAVEETDERIVLLEKERSSLEASLKELESRLLVAQEDVSKLYYLNSECKALQEKVESLQELLDKANEQADQASMVLQQNYELQMKVDRLEASLKELNSYKSSAVSSQQFDDLLQQKVKLLEERLLRSDEEIHSHVQMYQESMKEFQDTINRLKEESKRRAQDEPVDDMPWEFWSRLLLTIDGWLLEKKISSDDAKLLREMVWKRNAQIRDAYFACKYKSEHDLLPIFLKLLSSGTKSGLHVVHIAAEMAPVAKVGGLGDVVAGLSKALQKRGHLVEIILPKYDCMQYDRIGDLKALDVVVQSYFDGQLFKNKVWVGTIEGLPVYFIEPHHPAKFFWRGQVYGEHDDFKRFSFFSRAALELLLQAGKKPDIIHCHDWQTAFIAPLYWDIYAPKGLNSARICFTCHNFQYQGTAPASELGSCGLDVQQLNRPDRMQDNAAHDRVNPVKGAIVFSNIVTTVSPTYAQEVRAAEGGRGLHGTLISHAKKFVGILNGIDTDTWNPSTDSFLRFQYTADDLQGKAENKDAIRKQLKLSSADVNCPLVGCITRLVAQKGVHLIRHAIYRTLELGGQFVLLGSSPVPHIQREFEGIANHLENNPDVRLILKYDEALSHSIYAASDMFIIPSIFEPCGLTQMIAMRYGSVPIVRKTGGLSDSVFDVDDATIPPQFRNGFTFLNPDEQGLSNAMERAFNHYKKNPENWQQLVQRNMKIDFSWDSAAAQYEELYEKSVSRARAARSHV